MSFCCRSGDEQQIHPREGEVGEFAEIIEKQNTVTSVCVVDGPSPSPVVGIMSLYQTS